MQTSRIETLAREFRVARTLLTGLELDLFAAASEWITADSLAASLDCDPRGARYLLDALVSLELLEKAGNRYRTPPAARPELTGPARDALLHVAGMWQSWSHLTDCVRSGAPHRPASPVDPGAPDERTRTFIAAMHHGGIRRARAALAGIDLSGVSTMLDLGGGSGAWSIEFVRARPGLRATVFDLPRVVPLARAYIGQAGLADRIDVRAGDLLTDDLGGPFDLILVSAVSHIFDPERNRSLFARVRAALGPGGRLVIQDHLAYDDRTGPPVAMLFALNMLVNTEAGGVYTESEYREWLAGAGFCGIERLDAPGLGSLLQAWIRA